ncbi:MAG: hypothetical protein ACQERZ_08825 [Fusobacteriota bacterium]
MKPNALDFLRGVELQSNPDAAFQLMMFILLIIALILIAILIKKLPKIKRKKWDLDVYKFLVEYKNLSQRDINIIENLVKKYKIKPKYKLLILETELEKYIDREMMMLEQQLISSEQKDARIRQYIKLKEKIYGKEEE